MTTVYAAFQSHEAVIAAVEQLQRFGFSKAAIRLESDAVFRKPPAIVGWEEGFLSSVENFFVKLAGSSSPLPAGLYEETIRRGGSVVAVDVGSSIEEQTARALLRYAGAVDPVDYGELNNRPPADEPPLAGERTIDSETDFRPFVPGTYEVREQVETIRLTKTTRVIEELTVNKSISTHTETIHGKLRGTAIELEKATATAAFVDART